MTPEPPRPGRGAVAGGRSPAVGAYCRTGRPGLRRAFEEPEKAAPARRNERGAGPARGTPLAEPGPWSAFA